VCGEGYKEMSVRSGVCREVFCEKGCAKKGCGYRVGEGGVRRGECRPWCAKGCAERGA
jgi:hypothetical protein